MAPLRLDVLTSAAFEMDAAFRWYEAQQAGLGTEFLAACDAVFDLICRAPGLGKQVRPRLRRAVMRRFPFLVFYEVTDSRIVVLGVVHGRQSPDVWPFA